MHASWDHTLDDHRTAQREVIAAAAWDLAQRQGPFAVTMSQVAQAARVSRPTLYKYFADIESMLTAHHRKHVASHVAELEAILSGPGTAGDRLQRLLSAYAEICHQRARHGSAAMDRLVHSPFDLDPAESQLVDLFARAVREADSGRDDLTPEELALFAVRASAAAGDVSGSKVAAIARLVLEAVT